MAFAAGDMLIPGGVFLSAGKVAAPSSGCVSPTGLVFGTYGVGVPGEKIYNNGLSNVSTSGDVLSRKVTAYSGSTDFVGQRVQWVGKSAAFSGICTLQFDTELDDTDGDGTQEPVLEVRSDLGFFFLVLPANVEVVL